MITVADVADIAGVVLPLVITPGASFALTVAGAVEGPRWIGVRIALGTTAAISLIAAAVCFTPLAQALSDSRLARLLGYVGAAVLFGLAARVAYRATRTGRRPGPHQPGTRSASARAFTATIVNPKALTIYLVIVPGLAAGLIQRARWLGQPRSRRALQFAAAAGLPITAAILLLTART